MKNRVVIVTGASSGIGEALVGELAKRKAKIVAAARSIDKLTEMEKFYTSKGVEFLPVQVDVTNPGDCENLINKTIEKFGHIDVLINNAGISMRAMLLDTDLSVLHRLMDVNFWGTVNCTKYALPYLLDTKGSLVGVISIAGHVGLPARTGYAASKFAVRGFLDTLRIEYLRRGLHVLVAAPGFTASNIRKTALTADGSQQGETPRNEEKMMSAERCAEIIVKGIIKKKRSIIMTFIEGKLTVFLSKWWPSLLDRLCLSHMSKEPNSPF
ncbi:MAG: SDR family oxidoreductase [Bacteroidales bacterium]|nr:SDR family oxidoreductase [Bacteroidales bacterium]